jgi:hypothetical protein
MHQQFIFIVKIDNYMHILQHEQTSDYPKLFLYFVSFQKFPLSHAY